MAFNDPITSDIDIVSMANELVGGQKITSAGGGVTGQQKAERMYAALKWAELGKQKWRFAQWYQSVSVLTTLTPSFEGWNYFFQLPADLLILHYLTPHVKYARFGDRILTQNDPPITAVYNRYVEVPQWPHNFRMYMVYKLADMLAVSVTLSDRMVARIRDGLIEWSDSSKFADAQQESQRPIFRNPYKDVRY